MNNSASVLALHICSGHRNPMTPVQSLETLTGVGIKGDMHAIENSIRQILLVEQETLAALHLRPGIVKENITTLGIALMTLKRRQKLRIGNTLLQITSECEPCSRMEEIRPGLQELLRGRRGMLARVLQGGTVNVGEAIQLE